MVTRLVTALLAIAVATPALAQTQLQCAGTEPFWSVTVDDKTMVLRTPEEERIDLQRVVPRGALARLPDQLRVYESRILKTGKPATLVVTRNYDNCTDGMSEIEYAYDAVYFDNERVFIGCCHWVR
jgi:uncharacterized membrane protein